jgi:hypothetical protein
MIAFIWGAWMLQSTISVRYRIKLPSSLALIARPSARCSFGPEVAARELVLACS